MPVKFRTKSFKTDTCYHIYNRGTEGREIYSDAEDYGEFIQILERYLVKSKSETDTIYKTIRPYILRRREEMNLSGQVELLSICLMPDHFHLLLRQSSSDGIKNLMRRAMTYYSMYYNRKYQRSGPLFENIYRAVRVGSDREVLLLTKYIHINPVSRQVKRFGLVEASAGINPEYYLYSSYGVYLEKDTATINPEMVATDMVRQMYENSEWRGAGMNYRQFMELPVGNWEETLPGILIEKL